MSTNKTKNLNLHSWVETDPVLMSEFNENFDALDAESKKLANDISTLSSTMSNDISSLSTALTNDISLLNTAMTNSINSVNTTLTSKINSVNSALSSKIDTHAAEAAETYGNCHIMTGSYVGTGAIGPEYLNELHFPIAPKWLMITPQQSKSCEIKNLHTEGNFVINFNALRSALSEGGTGYANYRCHISSSGVINRLYLDNEGKTLRWGFATSGGYGIDQANEAAFIYSYIAMA